MAETSPRAIDSDLMDLLIEEHVRHALPRYDRLWRYYRNPVDEQTHRPAQAAGLPDRLRRKAVNGEQPQREQVIENDIAWRLHAMVDFMFGRPVSVQSQAPDPQRAALLSEFLRGVFQANGGVRFFQDLALLGNVYGFVDVLVRVEGSGVVLDLVEAPRAIAVLNPDDYRQLDAYVLHVRQQTNELDAPGFLSRVRDRVLHGGPTQRRAVVERTQVWTAERFEDHRGQRGAFGAQRTLMESSVNRLGRIPVVHIQNLPQPLFYEGLSEVEPLIPLQDELNTRLSDRANRVTFQSFKMYLGKGIEQFTERPVGRGRCGPPTTRMRQSRSLAATGTTLQKRRTSKRFVMRWTRPRVCHLSRRA